MMVTTDYFPFQNHQSQCADGYMDRWTMYMTTKLPDVIYDVGRMTLAEYRFIQTPVDLHSQ